MHSRALVRLSAATIARIRKTHNLGAYVHMPTVSTTLPRRQQLSGHDFLRSRSGAWSLDIPPAAARRWPPRRPRRRPSPSAPDRHHRPRRLCRDEQSGSGHTGIRYFGDPPGMSADVQMIDAAVMFANVNLRDHALLPGNCLPGIVLACPGAAGAALLRWAAPSRGAASTSGAAAGSRRT